ncbi:Uncharacterised protein [Mycobacteroides abscessus subsp. massiliense]|uniref:hypothetical protein n=1 Tax=Mycobacteroides abscessus TaxID=36809 RepID=UPI0009A56226|nr:hypothetical protein [Mycobacteroides abscessus]SLH95776.1 Uncharacterised protein [Mycobacteroides abscessus subsp. massiliense]SLI84129.1 Uncharacterised protein [Mycobacteroides abscessus subsp. massiliense]
MAKPNKCSRCQRRLRNNTEGWNVIVADGYVTGFLCPHCQSPQENAEAEINEATLDYTGADSLGRLTARLKVGGGHD